MSYKDHSHYPGLWAPLLMLLSPITYICVCRLLYGASEIPKTSDEKFLLEFDRASIPVQ